jgi:hypothetical protein
LLLRVLSFWDKSKHRKKTNTGFTASYTGLPTAAEIVLQGFIIQTKIVCMEQPLDFLQILQCRQPVKKELLLKAGQVCRRLNWLEFLDRALDQMVNKPAND